MDPHQDSDIDDLSAHYTFNNANDVACDALTIARHHHQDAEAPQERPEPPPQNFRRRIGDGPGRFTPTHNKDFLLPEDISSWSANEESPWPATQSEFLPMPSSITSSRVRRASITRATSFHSLMSPPHLLRHLLSPANPLRRGASGKSKKRKLAESIEDGFRSYTEMGEQMQVQEIEIRVKLANKLLKQERALAAEKLQIQREEIAAKVRMHEAQLAHNKEVFKLRQVEKEVEAKRRRDEKEDEHRRIMELIRIAQGSSD
ncbi:hypothetical protein HDU89_000589 [Geranomyces variabilis]|nr:hypothetical protein HDU89_000589 [Geranomyces variabilis]